jgi:ricin-type beta-trefoil lectin protein
MKKQRKISRLLVTGVLAAVSFSAVAAAADASYHPIVNFGSGKCAGLHPSEYFNNGASVVLQTCNGQPEQQWAVDPLGNDYYRLVNGRSGKCMDVRDGVNANGTQVQQWECTDTRGMNWHVAFMPATVPTRVQSMIGGRCLDVRNGSVQDGAIIQIYRCTDNNSAQAWSIN